MVPDQSEVRLGTEFSNKTKADDMSVNANKEQTNIGSNSNLRSHRTMLTNSFQSEHFAVTFEILRASRMACGSASFAVSDLDDQSLFS